jgi:hypothetical protein
MGKGRKPVPIGTLGLWWAKRSLPILPISPTIDAYPGYGPILSRVNKTFGPEY